MPEAARDGALREVERSGETEIEDHGRAIAAQQDVVRLDVAMDDALAVRLLDGARDIQHDARGAPEPRVEIDEARAPGRQRQADGLVEQLAPPRRAGVPGAEFGRDALQHVADRCSLHEIHDDEGRVAVTPELVHGDDVGVLQLGEQHRLLGEELLGIEGLRPDRRQHLDCHAPLQLAVLRLEDPAHAARADLLQQPVAVLEQRARTHPAGHQGLDVQRVIDEREQVSPLAFILHLRGERLRSQLLAVAHPRDEINREPLDGRHRDRGARARGDSVA